MGFGLVIYSILIDTEEPFEPLPFFVVITITPFAACAPQIDAAAASFNTVTLSTSSGLMVAHGSTPSVAITGNPSTTIKGELSPRVLLPLITIPLLLSVDGS